MDVTLRWDDDACTIVRWDFSGWIGVLDYIVPVNETAREALFADAPLAAIIHLGWKLPFPNRAYRYLAQAIAAAPPALGPIVIACRNPFARWIIERRLLNAQPILRDRVHIVNSLAQARALVSTVRQDAAPTALTRQWTSH